MSGEKTELVRAASEIICHALAWQLRYMENASLVNDTINDACLFLRAQWEKHKSTDGLPPTDNPPPARVMGGDSRKEPRDMFSPPPELFKIKEFIV